MVHLAVRGSFLSEMNVLELGFCHDNRQVFGWQQCRGFWRVSEGLGVAGDPRRDVVHLAFRGSYFHGVPELSED